MIFYINHFSLIIFYHSVWLGSEPLRSLSPGAYSDDAVLHPCAKDITIICHNKPPNKKWGWSVYDVRPRRDGTLKRQLLSFLPLWHAVGFFESRLAEII